MITPLPLPSRLFSATEFHALSLRSKCRFLSPTAQSEGRIENREEEQGKTFQFHDVEPARIGKVVEDGGDDWFVEKESVIDSGQMIDKERRDKINLRPGQRTPD